MTIKYTFLSEEPKYGKHKRNLVHYVEIVGTSSEQNKQRAEDHPQVCTQGCAFTSNLLWYGVASDFHSKRAINSLREAVLGIVVRSIDLDPVTLILEGLSEIDHQLLGAPDSQIGMYERNS